MKGHYLLNLPVDTNHSKLHNLAVANSARFAVLVENLEVLDITGFLFITDQHHQDPKLDVPNMLQDLTYLVNELTQDVSRYRH